MAWKGVITNGGAEMLAQWTDGKVLTITRAAAGTGRVSEAAMLAQTELVSEKQAVSIVSSKATAQGQRIQLQVTPQTLGYALNQFGIWATLGEEAGVESETDTLIALFQTDTDAGVEIPSSEDVPDYVYTFYGMLKFAGSDGELEVNIDTEALATSQTVAAAIEEHNEDANVHAVAFGTKQNKITVSGVLVGDGNGGVSAKPVDSTPAENSENLVTSGAVAAALAEKADLDENGHVPASQLPSYVDDVLDGYYHEGLFYTDAEHENQITPESGKVYVDVESNITYRWSGSAYVPIGSDLALGETASTAYRGDRGKIAYDHSQIKTGNPHNTKASDIGYTDNKELGASNLQAAMDAAAQKAIDAQTAAEAALEAITKIANTIDAVPSQSGTLTYTGSAQSPSWNNYNPDVMTLGGTTSGTNAGSYNATFTPKEGYTWSDGTNEAKTVTWSIGRASITTVPSQSGSLTYTGSAQSPAWSNYDSGKLTLGGTTSGTNAGSYNATFTPKANYQWSDGGTGAKNAAWSIGKAAGSLSISPTSVSMSSAGESKTITVTRSGTGAITASASPSGVVSVSVSGNVVTVTSVADGNATVTVNVAADTNYTAPAAKTCAAAVSIRHIYGVQWDGTSTTVWSRTDEAANFANPVPYVAGASSYGSPFDNRAPWSGMVRVTDSAAGELVAIPKFWYKWTKSGNTLKLQIADKAATGFHVSPAHADRGDGKGERDIVYVGRYHCHTSNYKSQTGGKPKANITRSTARSAIHNLGSAIYQSDIQMRMTIWMLYLVEFANWNSQAVIGKGCGNNSGTQNMGYTDSMPYHTGTTQSSRDTYGLGTQYRYIEGLWDNVYDWGDGCYYNGSGLNIIMNPNSFSDSSGGTAVGVPSSGWPSAFTVATVSGLEWVIYPTATGGSENTYSADDWYFGSSYPCLRFGGDYYQGGSHGLFYVYCSGASNSNEGIGCRLQKLP